jgi:hypothetical protein
MMQLHCPWCGPRAAERVPLRRHHGHLPPAAGLRRRHLVAATSSSATTQGLPRRALASHLRVRDVVQRTARRRHARSERGVRHRQMPPEAAP